MYFRLSDPPPFGWPSTFAANWKAAQYQIKREAGVEGDAIWIECTLEEVESHYFKELEKAVAQTNERYQETAEQKAQRAVRQSRLRAQAQAQLDTLNRALYANDVPAPGDNASPHFWASALMAKLRGHFRRRKG